MDLTKVLFITQELDPYLPGTPQGVYNRNVAQTLQESGSEVRTFMPKFAAINERRNQLHEVIRLSGLNIAIDDADHPLIIKVATLQPSRLQVYFIDNDDFFNHHTPTRELETDTTPEVNDERAMFFTRGVVETVKKLRWEPGLTYVSGWISALVPFYLRNIYAEDPAVAGTKIVFALDSNRFEGTLDARFAEKLKEDGFDDDKLATLAEPVDYIALCKLAIDYADAVIESTADIDPILKDYAKASGKPVMPFEVASHPEADEYKQFMQSL